MTMAQHTYANVPCPSSCCVSQFASSTLLRHTTPKLTHIFVCNCFSRLPQLTLAVVVPAMCPCIARHICLWPMSTAVKPAYCAAFIQRTLGDSGLVNSWRSFSNASTCHWDLTKHSEHPPQYLRRQMEWHTCRSMTGSFGRAAHK